MTNDVHWLTRAVELATSSVPAGHGPFGAVVVRDGEVVAEGTNRVTTDTDPTAHAEVVALRQACARLGVFDLSGAVLYSSCEPCPMCLGAALWARVDRVVFAADRDDAARAGFDDRHFHEVLAGRQPSEVPMENLRIDAALAPFEAWHAYPGRTAY
ncbi:MULTISPECIES: nucleoside deaminase [unclassified Isoptericola]|uniref:nucleoside deaminase n=1 Tax=unclassified Isoptericola TaxID=2623355 RepID=UPI002713FA05|nr:MULTISPECIES: nucleoside deaminase [unclassified Isoptericola]MDO8145268.1 nucleoside deaminase [Isoptericola sp. 178]MDO8148904.1 nucleoside deaminase [Isoptericola sp. b515]MDO8151153.1 nucleoside deaminase [Isoptericola sp. b408]